MAVNTRTAVHAYEHLPAAVRRRWQPLVVQKEGQEEHQQDQHRLQTIYSNV